MSIRHDFMWCTLVHLGMNMWCEQDNQRGVEVEEFGALPYLWFDRELWDKYLLKLKENGTNTIILDLADGLRYESHPELAIEGSWTREEMEAELIRLEKMGFEVIPKVNFSATHDIWMKEYSRMVSTPVYYQVCKDIIDEVCDIFKPRFFHLGMDEETYELQKKYDYVVVRQNELWWKDLYFLIDCVEKNGVRAMMWCDYAREHPEEFVEKCPKSVVQCNWYYFNHYGEDIERIYKIRVRPFQLLDEHGFDQLPTGSSIYSMECLELVTKHCLEHVSKEHLLGMAQTTWVPVQPEHEQRLEDGTVALKMARDWYESHHE